MSQEIDDTQRCREVATGCGRDPLLLRVEVLTLETVLTMRVTVLRTRCMSTTFKGYALVLCAFAACAEKEPAPFEPPPPPAAPEAATELVGCGRQGPKRFEPIDAQRSGPLALMQSDKRLLAVVADADEHALHTVDVQTHEQLAVTPLTGEPTHVLALSDGRLAVTMRYENRVAVYEPGPDWRLEERCATEVATEPIAMVERPSASELLVVSGFGAELAGLSTETLEPSLRIALEREPRAVVLSDAGDRAFVSHMVGGALSSVDLRPGRVRRADLDTGSMFAGRFDVSDEPRASNQGFALVHLRMADGAERLFVPGVSVDTGDLDEPISGGYGSTSSSAPNAVAPLTVVLDARTEKVLTAGVATARNDAEVDCLLPRAAAAQGDRLWVSCLGIDAVVELDARTAHPSMLEQRRFRVPAGPVGVAVSGDRLVVWSQFAKQLSFVDLKTGSVASQTLAHREKPRLAAELARGRALFHSTIDPRISSDHRACATCHPDGRDDGLVWSSPDGKRQTKFLAGQVRESAPYGWFGEHATLHEHLRGTFANLGGTGFAESKADFDALVAYVRELPAPRQRDSESELVARGQSLFESAEQGCASCHPRGATDGLAYDLGSGSRAERRARFDTPSLRFVGQSAPYFHDGRYASLRTLLRARDVQMGHAHSLGDDDLDALETYLRTL